MQIRNPGQNWGKEVGAMKVLSLGSPPLASWNSFVKGIRE